MRLVFALPLLVLVIGVVSGCGGDEDGTGAAPFEGTPWVLMSSLDVAGVAGAAPSATFADGTVGGATGCNRFSAPYTVDGDSLEIGTIASTQMACEPPLDAVERAYVAALAEVTGWSLEFDELTLSDADGGEVLRYTAMKPVGDWVATGFLQVDGFTSPIAGTEITATFGLDGSLSGSAGCNRYTATYETAGGEIKISAPAATRKACAAPAGVMEQEAAYLAALPTAVRFRADGRSLELVSADGSLIASYVRARLP